MTSYKKTYSDTPVLPDGQVLVRSGHPTVARTLVVKALRQAHDAEATLQAEIATRVAKLGAAREAGIAVQDEFDSAVNERTQTRKNLAYYNASLAGSQARLIELQTWIERNFSDSPTHEQFSELYRHEKMVQWIPALVEKSKARLVALDAQITRLAKENDLQVPA